MADSRVRGLSMTNEEKRASILRQCRIPSTSAQIQRHLRYGGTQVKDFLYELKCEGEIRVHSKVKGVTYYISSESVQVISAKLLITKPWDKYLMRAVGPEQCNKPNFIKGELKVVRKRAPRQRRVP